MTETVRPPPWRAWVQATGWGLIACQAAAVVLGRLVTIRSLPLLQLYLFCAGLAAWLLPLWLVAGSACAVRAGSTARRRAPGALIQLLIAAGVVLLQFLAPQWLS